MVIYFRTFFLQELLDIGHRPYFEPVLLKHVLTQAALLHRAIFAKSAIKRIKLRFVLKHP